MAEALLGRELAAATDVNVQSAGLVTEHQPASAEAVAVMAERGLDISGHRSRLLTPDMIGRSDLILGMTRQHLREVTVLDPGAWPRTFTLKELVRRAGFVGPRPVGEELADWLLLVGDGRVMTELLGEDPCDDVEDPIGRRMAFYRHTADELTALARALAAAGWPGAASEGAA